MPDDDGEVRPVLKPTNFRVTGEHIKNKLERFGPCDHWHTPLEGSVPGLGPRSKLAENYPQELASQIVTAIVQQLQCQMNDAILAVEDADAEAGEGANAGEIVEFSLPDIVNMKLCPSRCRRTESSGHELVEEQLTMCSVLCHCGSSVLVRMLREVQATEDVLEAAIGATHVQLAMLESLQHRHLQLQP